MSLTPQSSQNPIEILGKIAQGKFPIFLARSQDSQSLYVLKIYPYLHKNFLNESRFIGLTHPHVLSAISCSPISYPPDPKLASSQSYVMMEYAQNSDLFNLLFEKKAKLDETLARTYFQQLISGVEYLHKCGVAHLDLKLDNLGLDNAFQLKILDYDVSYIQGDLDIRCVGTQCYRAPEVTRKCCKDPYAADIYSCGVILFILMSGKNFPYVEDNVNSQIDLFDLMQEGSDSFWQEHEKLDEDVRGWDSEFKSLFLGMVRANSESRIKLNEIKESKWFNGKVYSREELAVVMEELTKK